MHSIKRTLGSVALVGTLFVAGVGCGSSGNKASFCSNAKKYSGKDFDAASGKTFTEAMNNLKSSAPSEIKDDMNYIAEWASKFQNVDQNDPKAAAEAVKGLDQKKLEKASNNIEKYLKDKCGIDTSS